MKIAVVGTIWLNTPPQNYGGTEEVVYNLVNGLKKRGHDVTFFGPATSKVNAHLVPTTISPLRDIGISWTNFTHTILHMAKVFDLAENFDIIHVHLNKSQDLISLPFSVYKNVPTVFTLHSPFPDKKGRPGKLELLEKYQFLPYTTISHTQQKDNLNYIATVYNGIDLNQYPFQPSPDTYVAWLGKISPLKGTKEAILAAQKAGIKLVLMGVIEKGVPSHYLYYKEEVLPYLSDTNLVFYEKVGLPQKAILLGKAKALLNPITWNEPFGLVMIEAQATGTPVIAFSHGAAPEVIKNGVTGFLVSSTAQMVEKIPEVTKLNRSDCRKHIQDNFSVEKMVDGYEKVYETVLNNWPQYYKRQIQSQDFII